MIHLLKIRNCKLKILPLMFFFFGFFALNVSAAVIQKPSPNLGLVGYWSMNEGTSTIALDYSGNKNKGTLTNGPKWVDGKRGKALNFDGSDDEVNVGAGSSLDITGTNITIAAWIYPRSFGGSSKGRIFDKIVTASSRGYAFFVDNSSVTNGLLFCFNACGALGGGNAAGSSANAITLNKWQHVVVTYNGINSVFYVDGRQAGSTGTNQAIGASPNDIAKIGRSPNTATREFNGLIDEVRIYNRALSAAEVSALYNVGAAKFTPPNNLGLVGYWSFNEGTSTIALDYSGNKNKGTLTNGPKWVDGKRGKALNFDGGDDEVNAGTGSSLNITGSITISAWIYPRTMGNSSRGIIAAKWNSSVGYAFNLDGFNATNALGLLINTGGGSGTGKGWSANNVITMNTWQHVAVTYTGSSLIFYVNGVLVPTIQNLSTAISSASAVNFKIGIYPAATVRMFDGLIDEVRVYNRALSAVEVSALYNVGAVKYTPPNNLGLVGYWSFNEGASTVALDYSGKKNKGTLVNGPTWVDGKRGKALSFDGGNDYVNATNAVTFSTATSFSASAWVKTNTTAAGAAYVLDRTAGINSVIDMRRGTTDANFRIRGDNGEGLTDVAATGVLSVGVWVHVVGVRDVSDDTIKIYINGSLKNSATDNTTSQISHVIRIGNHSSGAPGWDGLIDDVRIYNRALGADEVKKLYESR